LTNILKHTINNKIVNIKNNYRNDKDFTLFLCVGFLAGIAGGINSTVFNNFLSDVYHLSSTARGFVELPRELPGFFIALVLAALMFLGDIRIASIGMFAASIGMIGLGLFSPTFTVMIVFLMILSLGTHMFMPLAPSIGMALSEQEQYGVRLGRFNAFGLVAAIIGYAIVWVGFKYLHFSYQIAFVIAAVFYMLAAFTLFLMSPQKPHHKTFKIIFRKRYTLYYILCIVNGARKQIFLTFAPWVLIQIFHVDPPTFAVLGVIIAVLSIITRTIVGNAIDSLGERKVLSAEAVLLIILCMGYAFASSIFPVYIAVIIIAMCYILDNSMSAVEMARSTYMRKIALTPSDVTHTLSTGISLDHAVSMTIPILGGILWATCGYPAVFIAAAVIAATNLFLSLKIRTVIE
jgi:predicted MFS family arabinose efflux permease